MVASKRSPRNSPGLESQRRVWDLHIFGSFPIAWLRLSFLVILLQELEGAGQGRYGLLPNEDIPREIFYTIFFHTHIDGEDDKSNQQPAALATALTKAFQ
jgi:hypothetical protein